MPSPHAASFEPVEIVPGDAACGVLFLCDHASNALPAAYGSLGLPPTELARHIGYDIGAADVTRALAAAFGAPAVLTRFSRLLIDPNRGLDDPTLVMRLSDGAIVPGNARVDAREIARRVDGFWRPYRDAAARQIAAMAARPPAIVAIHSFTPEWRGVARPWQVGVLWDCDPRLAQPFIAALRRDGALTIGDNEPYDGALRGDVLDACATQRGLAGMLVELRQDLIAEPAHARAWADRLAGALQPVIDDPRVRVVRRYPTRAA